MTDAEWSAWQSSWTGGAMGPLPDVRARARREARSHQFANVAFFALVAVALAALAATFGEHDPGLPAVRVMILLFLAAMSIGYLVSKRDLGKGGASNPRAALAFLERRLVFERRMAHVVRWAYAGTSFAFIFVFPYLVWHHERSALEMALTYPGMALTLLVTFSAPWWVERRNRRHYAEIEEWRRWMDEQQI